MVDTNLQNQVEGLRSREQWVRYDTHNVGRNARQTSTTWSETFADFANQDLLTFNDGSRTKNVGKSYCNQSGNTEDWAQEIYQTGVEFFAPVGDARSHESLFDAVSAPTLWCYELPKLMSISIKLQDTDEVLLVPAIHLPAATGVTNAGISDPGIPAVFGGNTGNVGFRDGWTWPEPLLIPKKAKMVCEVTFDRPLRPFFQQLDGNPRTATYTVFDAQGNLKQVSRDLWFGIRIWHRGPRRVQLRGAYSA